MHPLADFERDGRNDEDGDGDENPNRSDDHRGERKGEECETVPEAANDGAGQCVGRPGFHHHAGEHTGGEDAQHRAHDALRAGDEQVDGLGEVRVANETGNNRPEEQ